MTDNSSEPLDSEVRLNQREVSQATFTAAAVGRQGGVKNAK